MLTLVVAGLASLVAMKKIMAAAEAAKVKVKAHRFETNVRLQRLRQDPRTGIYYPDN